MGDLNYIMDPSRDKSYNKSRGSSVVTLSSKLHDLVTKFSLVDIWHWHHGTEKDYTYYSSHHQVFTRIDYFLTDGSSTEKVSSCNISPMLWSDHAWLECHLNTMAEKDPHRQWTFDKHILLSDLGKQELTTELEDYFRIS